MMFNAVMYAINMYMYRLMYLNGLSLLHVFVIPIRGLVIVTAVMNGVEFRTRHNDYQLVQPVSHSLQYEAVEDITFPSVPPEVLKPTVYFHMRRSNLA